MPHPPQDPASESKRAFEHGSSGASADAAVEGRPSRQTRSPDAPAARPATPQTSPDDALKAKRRETRRLDRRH